MAREFKTSSIGGVCWFKRIFSQRFQRYETADLFMKGVDHKIDIKSLPFEDGTYDFIFASHVLQLISDDKKAIKEIHRVLRQNGIAILPVPVACTMTIEYSQPNPHENGQVRNPGLDYFERYKQYFARVNTYTSDSFAKKYQPFVYKDQSVWPTKESPLRPPMQGKKHADFVPVCYT